MGVLTLGNPFILGWIMVARRRFCAAVAVRGACAAASAIGAV